MESLRESLILNDIIYMSRSKDDEDELVFQVFSSQVDEEEELKRKRAMRQAISGEQPENQESRITSFSIGSSDKEFSAQMQSFSPKKPKTITEIQTAIDRRPFAKKAYSESGLCNTENYYQVLKTALAEENQKLESAKEQEKVKGRREYLNPKTNEKVVEINKQTDGTYSYEVNGSGNKWINAPVLDDNGKVIKGESFLLAFDGKKLAHTQPSLENLQYDKDGKAFIEGKNGRINLPINKKEVERLLENSLIKERQQDLLDSIQTPPSEESKDGGLVNQGPLRREGGQSNLRRDEEGNGANLHPRWNDLKGKLLEFGERIGVENRNEDPWLKRFQDNYAHYKEEVFDSCRRLDIDYEKKELDDSQVAHYVKTYQKDVDKFMIEKYEDVLLRAQLYENKFDPRWNGVREKLATLNKAYDVETLQADFSLYDPKYFAGSFNDNFHALNTRLGQKNVIELNKQFYKEIEEFDKRYEKSDLSESERNKLDGDYRNFISYMNKRVNSQLETRAIENDLAFGGNSYALEQDSQSTLGSNLAKDPDNLGLHPRWNNVVHKLNELGDIVTLAQKDQTFEQIPNKEEWAKRLDANYNKYKREIVGYCRSRDEAYGNGPLTQEAIAAESEDVKNTERDVSKLNASQIFEIRLQRVLATKEFDPRWNNVRENLAQLNKAYDVETLQVDSSLYQDSSSTAFNKRRGQDSAITINRYAYDKIEEFDKRYAKRDLAVEERKILDLEVANFQSEIIDTTQRSLKSKEIMDLYAQKEDRQASLAIDTQENSLESKAAKGGFRGFIEGVGVLLNPFAKPTETSVPQHSKPDSINTSTEIAKEQRQKQSTLEKRNKVGGPVKEAVLGNKPIDAKTKAGVPPIPSDVTLQRSTSPGPGRKRTSSGSEIDKGYR